MNYKTYTNFEFKFNSLFNKCIFLNGEEWVGLLWSLDTWSCNIGLKKFASKIQHIEHFDWCQLYNVEYYGIAVTAFGFKLNW